jgi:tetratricopeptide (TPR) repeat protein
MENIVFEIDKYITENIEIDTDYLKEVSNRFNDVKELKIFYLYGLFKTNQIKLAYKELQALNLTEKNNNDSLYLMVKCLIEKNQDTERDLLIECLNKILILDKNKKNKWLRLELFKLYEKKEMDYLAWGHLEDALSIDEGFCEAILIRAYRLDLIENCSDVIQQIIQLPQSFLNSDILNYLGNAFLNCGNIENAIKIFNGSIEISETEEAYYFLGYINHYHLTDYETALNYYDKSININNQFIDVLIEKAWLLFDMNKFDETELLFKDLMLTHQNDQEVFNQLILFFLKRKRNSEALNYINESKRKFGSNHMNDGFELICLEKLKNKEYIYKFQKYKNKYSSEEMIWFKMLLKDV